MCVAAIAIGQSTTWPLAIASNRDEFFDRPTAPLQRWTHASGQALVSGRDLRDGGTWLGFSATRAALLTNVREGGTARGQKSRGELVLRWLAQGAEFDAFYAGLALADYGGFNLLAGNLLTGQWHYLSNRNSQAPRRLPPGIYGLSNASLDTAWPKTRHVKSLLAQALVARTDEAPDEAVLAQTLLTGLTRQNLAPDDELPQTGVPLSWERGLSSTFVHLPEMGYGTRCSTVALLGADRQLRVTERSHANPLAPQPATAWPGTVRESVLLAPYAPHR